MRPAGAALLLFILFAGLPLAVRPALARGYDELGALEREALDEALLARGLFLDPAPDGKRIGTVHVVNHEVFSRRDWIFPFFNVFHRTTREEILRREVLLRPGQLYDQELVDETVRNLQAGGELSNVVVLLPVKSPQPGVVDLLLVTRDVWSLRLNSNFEFQAGRLLFLALSMAENNVFGWRKQASFDFSLNLGSYALGPTYYDPNIRGTRLTFYAMARAWFARDTGRFEGTSSHATLSYPLYALASRWGGALDVSQSNTVVRSFLGNDLRVVDVTAPEVQAVRTLGCQGAKRGSLQQPPCLDQAGPSLRSFESAPDLLPWAYRLRRFSLSASVTRRFGHAVLHGVTLGHEVALNRPDFLDGTPEDPGMRARFADKVFPRSERTSSPYLSYGLSTPRFKVYRDFGTYDLRETVRLGPSLRAGLSYGVPALGSEFQFLAMSASAGYTGALFDGYQSASVGWGGRLQDGRVIDESGSFALYFASPVVAGLGRLLLDFGGSTLWRNQYPSYLSLGGDSGLRGYVVGAFLGKTRLLGHLEARSRPVPLASLRLGAVAFWDAGHVAPTFSDIVLHHDLGAGLRLLIPHINTYVLRLDWAFATSNSYDPRTGAWQTRAGWPGRISFGFQQVF